MPNVRATPRRNFVCPTQVWDRLLAYVGRRGGSAFIVQAITEKLDREGAPPAEGENR